MKPSLKCLILCLSFLTLFGCSNITKIDVEMNSPSNSGVALKDLRVMYFNGGSKSDGRNFSNMISQNLIQQNHIALSSNSRYRLTGRLQKSAERTQTWKEKRYDEKKKKTYYKYYAQAKRSMGVNYELTYRGRTVASGSFMETFDKKYRSSDSYGEVKAKVPQEQKTFNKMMKKLAWKVTKDISPHKEIEALNFLKGSDDNIALGNEYVERKAYEQAFAIYGQVANQTSDIEDQSVAMHNQGMVKLISGNYSEAYALISRANLIDPRNLDILDNLRLVERYKNKHDQFKAQTK